METEQYKSKFRQRTNMKMATSATMAATKQHRLWKVGFPVKDSTVTTALSLSPPWRSVNPALQFPLMLAQCAEIHNHCNCWCVAVLPLCPSPPQRGEPSALQQVQRSCRWWRLDCCAAALSCRRCTAATIGADRSKACLLSVVSCAVFVVGQMSIVGRSLDTGGGQLVTCTDFLMTFCEMAIRVYWHSYFGM